MGVWREMDSPYETRMSMSIMRKYIKKVLKHEWPSSCEKEHIDLKIKIYHYQTGFTKGLDISFNHILKNK
jgi:hypothetical protein